MKKEHDFPMGERGKFFRPATQLSVPVYLDPAVAEAVQKQAGKRRTTVGALVNQWLRNSLRTARQGR